MFKQVMWWGPSEWWCGENHVVLWQHVPNSVFWWCCNSVIMCWGTLQNLWILTIKRDFILFPTLG